MTVAHRMASAPNVKLIEVNVSCPNVKEGGIAFGTEPQMVRELTQAIKAQVDCPVLVKLTPAVTAIEPLALAAEAGGADGLVMINTLMGMEIDLHTRKPHLSNGTGGLSGKAIHPLAVRMVHQARQVTDLPIIGVGGRFYSRRCVRIDGSRSPSNSNWIRKLRQSAGVSRRHHGIACRNGSIRV